MRGSLNAGIFIISACLTKVLVGIAISRSEHDHEHAASRKSNDHDDATLLDALSDHNQPEHGFHTEFVEPNVSLPSALAAAWLDSIDDGFGENITGEIFFIQRNCSDDVMLADAQVTVEITGWIKGLVKHSLYQLQIGTHGDATDEQDCLNPELYFVQNGTSTLDVIFDGGSPEHQEVTALTTSAPLYGRYSVVGRMLILRRLVNETHDLVEDKPFARRRASDLYTSDPDKVTVACGVIGIANNFKVSRIVVPDEHSKSDACTTNNTTNFRILLPLGLLMTVIYHRLLYS